MIVHAYTIYGAGPHLPGMERLASELRRVPGVAAPPTYDWTARAKIISAIKEAPTSDKLVLIGHSCGANDVTIICNDVAPREVALAVCFNLTFFYSILPFGVNVASMMEFYGWNFFDAFGQPMATFDPSFAGKKLIQYSADSHTTVEDDQKLHDLVINAVKGLTK